MEKNHKRNPALDMQGNSRQKAQALGLWDGRVPCGQITGCKARRHGNSANVTTHLRSAH